MAKKITQNVNKDNFLNDLPKVRPEFSKWSNRHTNYQTCNAGDIVPIYYDEVLPGEKRKITLGMISHTTTPIAPIFPAMYTEIRAFFVPHRLSADLLNGYSTRKSPWVDVFGEDSSSTGSEVIVPLASQRLPLLDADFSQDLAGNWSTRQDCVFDSLDLLSDDVSLMEKQNFLNLAAYELIYQRHYRNENYESATQSPLYRCLFGAYNGYSSDFGECDPFELACKEKDYFTGAKPFTQKSSEPIRVNLGEGDLPVKVDTPSSSSYSLSLNTGSYAGGSQEVQASNSGISGNKLYVDISSAQGISIEELRLLIKTQELLEKDAMYGTRYAESLNAHFGTCPLDLTLQDPQELYKTTITSQMQAIFQTSTTKDEASILGTIGANSSTQTEPFIILPETEFKEHGLLMICAVHKLQNVYDSSFFKPKFNFKTKRFDFYTPELNDLGFQPVTKEEFQPLFVGDVAGYNEAFAEYRFVFNKRHGRLNSDFRFWAPAIEDDFGSIQAIYKQTGYELDSALSVSSGTAPQFYDAWGFEEECTKPMSLHSIPGMDGVI